MVAEDKQQPKKSLQCVLIQHIITETLENKICVGT